MTDREHYFHGHEPRECGFHDSTGDRAWCSDCTEWCYEAIPCRGCELPSLRAEVEQLRDELWPVVAMRNGALNRAEAAEAKLDEVRVALRAGGLTAAVRIHDALTILAAPAEADS